MSNPAGVVHGGILCSAADLAMGFLSLYFARDAVSGITPTVNMSHQLPAAGAHIGVVLPYCDH